MSANPYYALWLVDTRHYDQLTLILAGVALLAVLGGWAMQHAPRWQKCMYFGFMLLVFILSIAGATYLIITGGPS